jgi:hypothetical protein
VSKLDNVFDNQHVKANSDIVKNESGHLSGHDCPDKPKTNGINGQSGQSKVDDSVRYNEVDGNDIKPDIGHFINHVR